MNFIENGLLSILVILGMTLDFSIKQDVSDCIMWSRLSDWTQNLAKFLLFLIGVEVACWYSSSTWPLSGFTDLIIISKVTADTHSTVIHLCRSEVRYLSTKFSFCLRFSILSEVFPETPLYFRNALIMGQRENKLVKEVASFQWLVYLNEPNENQK